MFQGTWRHSRGAPWEAQWTSEFLWPSKSSAEGKRTKQPLVLAGPDPLQPSRLSQGSSTARVPTPYLIDFTEGFCGLPYLFQSSPWKVCIQTNCLWKGEVACDIASHGLSNNQKNLEGGGLSFFGAEGQVLLTLADHHMVPSLYCCSAWDKCAGTEGIPGERNFYQNFLKFSPILMSIAESILKEARFFFFFPKCQCSRKTTAKVIE